MDTALTSPLPINHSVACPFCGVDVLVFINYDWEVHETQCPLCKQKVSYIPTKVEETAWQIYQS